VTADAPTQRRTMSARKQKVILLVSASVACAIPGVIALAIESETLGYVSVGVLLAGILLGPVIDRMRGPDE
jgi:LytS/YehU family sensor histidine kinase